MEKKDLTKTTSHLKPYTISLIKDSSSLVTPKDAWVKGTNIRTAVKNNPAIVRGWIMSEVGRLIKEIDANKTLSTDEELQFCCRSILEEHPTLKLEELRACFIMIRQGKFGKLFERLKTAEILECLRRYEGEVRTEIMEKLHREKKAEDYKPIERSKDYKPLGEYLKDVLNEPVPKLKKPVRVGARLKERNYNE
jgi:hypothetical protein